MTPLSTDVAPERAGTLGSYVKFAEGRVGTSVLRDSIGVITYHEAAFGRPGKMLAIEAIPGMEKAQKESASAITILIERESDLNEQEAQWVCDRLLAGVKTDAS